MTDHSHRNAKVVCWISIWSKLEMKNIIGIVTTAISFDHYTALAVNQ